MLKFEDTLTEQKNTHMTHIEDKVLYGGVKGTREAILALRELRDMLKGSHSGSVSVKWDGAPAIFAEKIHQMANSLLVRKVSFIRNLKFIKLQPKLMKIHQVTLQTN